MTYFNPKSIQNFTNVANEGKFLKKTGNDIAFANVSSRMKFVNFTGSTWNFDATDDATFTYGTINANTVVTILSPTDISKREILHILRIDNTDNVKHTVSFQTDSVQTELLSPYQFNVYANSSIEFIATAFMDSDDGSAGVNPKTQVSIYAVYGYEPYNAVINPMQFLVLNDLPQSDWNQANPLEKDFIKNKPDIVSSILFNGTPATISDGIATITATIPDAQIQSDWAQTDIYAVDYIKNKPVNLTDFNNDLTPTTINVVVSSDGTYATITVNNSDGTHDSYIIPLSNGGGGGTQLPANWTENDNTSVQYILNKPTLAAVATSGSYNDLLNTPSIPAAQVQSDWDAVSGMGEILHKPTNVSAFTNDAGYITAHQSIDSIVSSPSAQTAPVVAQSLAGGDTITLHKVAWTGTYGDLINKPAIPVVPTDVSAFNNDAGYLTSATIPAQAQANWTENDNTEPSYIQNKPSLATVATSGDYGDLVNTPVIPAAQVNSDWDAISGVAQILNKPTIPTDVSDLNNDAGYITASDIPEIPEDSVDYLRFDFTDNVTRLLNLQAEGNVPVISLEYKVVSITTGNVIEDWTEWPTITNTQNRTLLTTGPVRIYLRGDNYNVTGFTTSIYYHFTFSSNNCNCGGNLLTIYKKDGNVVSIPQDYRFYKLFAKVGAQTCNIKSAPYVKLYSTTTNSSSNTCFNYIFDGNTNGISSLKRLGCAVLIGSDDFNNSVLGTHTLGTAIDQKTGRIYVEKPDASSYIVTLTYGDNAIDFSTLVTNYNAGKQIRCKDTVNGITIYADLYSYDVTNVQLIGNVTTFVFKYIEADSSSRECTIYKLYKAESVTNPTWESSVVSLDELPATSSSTYGQFLTNDALGLKWDDVIPNQTGESGKFLTTDGSVLSWGTPQGGGGGSVGTLNTNNSGAQVVSSNESLSGTINLHKVSKTGSYSDLLNLPSIPAAQIQSNWAETNTSSKAYIQNKPVLAAVAVSGNYNDLSNKPSIPQSPIQSNWNEGDSSSLAYIQNKPSLATVATSGSYNDLSNKPTIPAAQVNADWNAISGVAEILNKPTIPTVPTNVSAFNNDAGYLTSETQANWNETNTSSAAYILNKPAIPANLQPAINSLKIDNVGAQPLTITLNYKNPLHFILQFDVVPNASPYIITYAKGNIDTFIEGIEYKLILYNNTSNTITTNVVNPWNGQTYTNLYITGKKYAVLSMWFYTVNNEEKTLFMEYNYSNNTYGVTNITML